VQWACSYQQSAENRNIARIHLARSMTASRAPEKADLAVCPVASADPARIPAIEGATGNRVQRRFKSMSPF
jgi:hypothetical protein